MRRYFQYSLLLHAALFVMLVIFTFASPRPKVPRMELIVLPKGTSLDAVLTQEVLDAMKSPAPTEEPQPPAGTPDVAGTPAAPTPEPSPQPAAAPTPVATPEPSPRPSPTPIKMATPTPTATAPPTPKPEKTMEVAPKESPKPSPKPSPTPEKKKPTPTPTPKSKPSPARQKESAKAPKPSPTPKAPKAGSKPSSDQTGSGAKPLISAYDLPQATPSNVEVAQARPGQEIGVPGIPEGVEGAPLPLDRTQNVVSMLWATRARMKIQSNFTVPPGVNDPNMTCEVEWEILRDGTIQNVRVVKSTGSTQYDSFAIDALLKTANLGPLPPEIKTESIWTSLKFVYSAE
jgi:TonB family protein